MIHMFYDRQTVGTIIWMYLGLNFTINGPSSLLPFSWVALLFYIAGLEPYSLLLWTFCLVPETKLYLVSERHVNLSKAWKKEAVCMRTCWKTRYLPLPLLCSFLFMHQTEHLDHMVFVPSRIFMHFNVASLAYIQGYYT